MAAPTANQELATSLREENLKKLCVDMLDQTQWH